MTYPRTTEFCAISNQNVQNANPCKIGQGPLDETHDKVYDTQDKAPTKNKSRDLLHVQNESRWIQTNALV